MRIYSSLSVGRLFQVEHQPFLSLFPSIWPQLFIFVSVSSYLLKVLLYTVSQAKCMLINEKHFHSFVFRVMEVLCSLLLGCMTACIFSLWVKPTLTWREPAHRGNMRSHDGPHAEHSTAQSKTWNCSVNFH